jgi:diguanylate cyclase (GGDEF)-like protein/PAS domain S-box-containing protein
MHIKTINILNKQTHWLKQLISSAHIGILAVDKDRNIIFINDRLSEMFGYSKKEILQTNTEILHVNHETYLNFAKLAFDFVLKGKAVGIDYQFKKKDGTLFWIHIAGDVVEGQEGVLWTLVDISREVQIKKELTYQYSLLESVIDTTPDLIFYKDYLNQDGKYIGCNKAFCSFIGKSKDEIINHTDIELFGDKIGGFFRKKDTQILKRNTTIENQKWVTYPNGHKVLLNTIRTPFRDDKNELIGILGISRDITNIHNSTKNLIALNERLELALLGNNDGVWDWNLETDEIYYSPRWKEMLGYKDNELANNFKTWEERANPEDIPKVMLEIKKCIKGEIQYLDNIHRIKHKDGHWIWVHDRARAIYDKNSKAIRISGTHTDITHQKELQLKNTQQTQIINQIHDSVVSTDLDGNITSWNHASEVILGYSAQEMIGKHITYIYPEEDYDALDRNIKLLKKHGFRDSEAKVITKNGEIIYIDLSLSLLKDEDNYPIGMIGYSKDITKRKQIQNDLAQQHKFLQSIIDGVDDPIMVIKKDYNVELMNNTLKNSSKNTKFKDINNPKCYEISHNRSEPCDGIEHPCPLKSVLKKKEHEIVVHSHHDSKGNQCYVELSATPLFNNEKNCIGIIESSRDITIHLQAQDELRIQKDILHHQAHHDSLTGLPNRILFQDRLDQAIKKAKRNNSTLALLFIDLDHFKEINDSLGHKAGDEVLKIVTNIFRNTIRKEDTIARLGGDEFTIILEDLRKPQDASILAKKLLKELSKPIMIENNELYVSSSIGISIYPDDGVSSIDLLKYADAAMYRAKDEGRNNFQYYTPEMTEMAFKRVVMEANLRDSLKNNHFVVYYQPQIDGTTDKIIGMEALVRWNHPSLGIVSPTKFIPLAESTGLIVELDRFVMKTAMTQISTWYKQGLNPGVLAMNLAVKQLQQKDFISMFKKLMKKTECKPEWIELEVTEGQIMQNPQKAIKILKQINNLGVELAVDDFGTGYSSLSYLKKFPINKLKIDQVFVKDLPKDEEDVAITRAVIALANSLKLKVIAEGVEDKKQKDFIVENGCKNIQGYFYSKPIPAKDMEILLKSGIPLGYS